jgi:hypothetical protein
MSAMTLIQTITVGSGGAASIEFTSIPQTFTDLLVKFSLRTTLEFGLHFDDMGMRLNGDTGNNYLDRVLRTREGAVGSFIGNPSNFMGLYEASASGAPASTFGTGEVYIPSYRSSSSKVASTEGYSASNSTSQVQAGLVASLWTGSAGVNAIRLYSRNARNLVEFSTATLYGITAGSSGGVVVS